MATIIRGKHKNKEVKIRQFCNDWFSVEHHAIPTQETIINPTSLLFTDEEKERIELAKSQSKTGFMFNQYYWNGLNLRKK